MSSLRLVPFSAGHLGLLGELSDTMAGMGQLQHETLYGQRLEIAGPSFSAFDAIGRLVGCGGIGIYWRGVGEAWLILSSLIQDHSLSLHRLCTSWLSSIIETERLHRVQAVVPVGNGRARKWIMRLGFQYEGLMPEYGPDRAYFERFGRITAWRH